MGVLREQCLSAAKLERRFVHQGRAGVLLWCLARLVHAALREPWEQLRCFAESQPPPLTRMRAPQPLQLSWHGAASPPSLPRAPSLWDAGPSRRPLAQGSGGVGRAQVSSRRL
eukprot:NODE_3838_length_738_cov_285.469985.p3 GENE.NODE_3838_length_738_cov_285.469985~~NODE_3838_length_738_cov_285.469985.p3  ORF type:complete len:113 (+),score=19.47 NODE_3838_length_738_cov_285.469985:3-341(+)